MNTEIPTLRTISPDGTDLAVWVGGTGPALVMVHGSIRDHTTFDPLVAELRTSMTTYAMDRRGFGASGDADEYHVESEFDDVAAVVDTVAETSGGPVALWGHSFGASCAMGGAARTDHVAIVDPLRAEPRIDLSRGIDPGDRRRRRRWRHGRGAVDIIFVDILEMNHDELDAVHRGEAWPAMIANAHTIAREARVEQSWSYEPGQFAAISAPTVLLTGTESPPDVVLATERAAAAIPGSRILTLDGHAHTAHKSDPAMIAQLIFDLANDHLRPL